MKKTFLAIIAVALVASSCGQAPSTALTKDDKSIAEAIDSYFSAAYPDGEPGAAVIVLHGDKVIFDKGYGIADINTKAPIDDNTFFNIASMSKQFSAVAILQLAEQGLLSVDDPVTKFFPEYTDPIWEGITIHHLMCHSSGIPDARGGYSREEKIAATDSLATAFLDTLSFVNFAPGEKYEYINPTFTLLGKIVERVTGQEFGEYMHEHVFVPAGMEKTLYITPENSESIENMAHGYVKNDEGQWEECDFGEETFFATRPDGGIYTSTSEFVNWEKALREGKVISAESLELAMTPKNPMDDGNGSSYGYGWVCQPFETSAGEAMVIYHNGGNGGFRSTGLRYPADNILVAAFSNRHDFKWYEVKAAVEEILYK